MLLRLAQTISCLLITQALSYGQQWNSWQVAEPRPLGNCGAPYGAPRASVYDATYSPAVWRDSFNGLSARPVATSTYQTVAYPASPYGSAYPVAYPTACNTHASWNYPPAGSYTTPVSAAAYSPYGPYASVPPSLANVPVAYSPGNYGAGSRYYLGHGLFGQPRAFGQGEPLRNFFRYLLP